MSRRVKMRSSIAFLADGWQLAVLLALLWYGLAGSEGWHFGIPVIVLSVVASRLFVPMRWPNFSLAGLAGFIVHFLGSSLLGGFDVARRAVDPRVPLEIVNHRYAFRLPQGQPRMVFIATVSLLPGTLSRSVDDQYLTVHSIAGDKTAELETLEYRIARLFTTTLEG